MEFKIEKYARSRTDEELLHDLKRVADANNGKLTQKIYKQFRKDIDPSIADDTTISRQIGWNNALKKIGIELEKSQLNQRVPKEELLEELLRLWMELGRQPTTTDLKNGLSKYPRERFSARFGTWGNTLEAFVEWVNNDQIAILISTPIERTLARTTSRDINLRLRFKIMQRDNFKCCACGKAPATDPTVELHVDHIMPWSKGGETEIENLQTLCSKCNLGKGDL